MKKQATHFIEVWKDNDDDSIEIDCVMPISLLERELSETILLRFETIAIFKIYPKNK